METAWWHQPSRSGEGILIFVDRDGSTAGTMYLPGGKWFFLADFMVNPFTRQLDFAIGRQDALNTPLVRVGAGHMQLQPDGSAEIMWDINGFGGGSGMFVKLMPSASAAQPPAPFPPPPEPPHPVEPVTPVEPVIPPGIALNPIVVTWADLFGREFGQPGSGWDLDPPYVLHNRTDGLCDVLSIAFRVPDAASGFHYGRFTQNPDGGAILQWFSDAPCDLSFAQSDPLAWTVGDLAWEAAGTPGHPTQVRAQLTPGEVYYLNAAFVKSALITDNELVPTTTQGEYQLTATQLS